MADQPPIPSRSTARPGLITRPSSRLTVDKTIVLVTGGNQGVGYEIVKALATSKPNFQVLMGCRDTRQGEAAVASMGAPTNVNPIQLDLVDDQSIDHCRKAIEQLFGRLDTLVNNAGTGGADKGQNTGIGGRQVWEQVLNVNVASTGYLTEQMIPLLERSRMPKIIFLTSRLGSIGLLEQGGPLNPTPWYNCSKAAVNMLALYYAKAYPRFRVNASDPGYRAASENSAEPGDATDPQLGAVNVVRLANEGPDGATGTYTNSEGTIPW